MDKAEFIGQDALAKAKAAGVKRTLVGLEMIERGIAARRLQGSGSEAATRSATSPAVRYAPFLKKNIALAYVPPSSIRQSDTEVAVEIRGQAVKAQGSSNTVLQAPKKTADRHSTLCSY